MAHYSSGILQEVTSNPLGQRFHATSGFEMDTQIEQVERGDWIEWTDRTQ